MRGTWSYFLVSDVVGIGGWRGQRCASMCRSVVGKDRMIMRHLCGVTFLYIPNIKTSLFSGLPQTKNIAV
jgi:hypothetical protein